MRFHLFALTSLISGSLAWLPATNTQHLARDGNDLFKRDSSPSRDTTHSILSHKHPRSRLHSHNHHKRYLPDSSKPIRGVNAGNLFIFEPWLDSAEWSAIGCGNAKSEFDCGLQLGQDGVDKAMQQHWENYYTQDDINLMVQYGLNTLRVPVGYWFYEDIVDRNSEPFPRGGFTYLQRLCDWASSAGLYIIIDFHGLPGAQDAQQPFTGQYASTPGFYSDDNYNRALSFLEWITEQIHSNSQFRNVGMLEIANEPVQNQASYTDSMRQSYYPDAFTRIRNKENSLGIGDDKRLHIQMMAQSWGAGDPRQYLTDGDDTLQAFDSHRYLKYQQPPLASKDDYLRTSCQDAPSSNDGTPLITGEFSLSVADNLQDQADWNPSTNQQWYLNWFAAQARAYEKGAGWVFWTWKANLNDERWSFKDAVQGGIVPGNLDDVDSIASGACSAY